MTDTGSKFGTWLNGRRLEASERVIVSSGDSVKFGGLESDFTYKSFYTVEEESSLALIVYLLRFSCINCLRLFRIESVPVCVFVGEVSALNARSQLAALAARFAFSLSSDLSDPSWNFAILPDSIAQVTPGLLAALARSASIVRLEHFTQLAQSGGIPFSEGLLQPHCSTLFPPQCLLPRAKRCEALSTALTGVRRLVCLEEGDYALLRTLESCLNVSVVLVTGGLAGSLPFCDLLVCAPEGRVGVRVDRLTRSVTAGSLIEAFLHADETLLCIENIFPAVEASEAASVAASDHQSTARTSSEPSLQQSNHPPAAAALPPTTSPLPATAAANSTRNNASFKQQQPMPFVETSPVLRQPMPASLLRPIPPPTTTAAAAATGARRFVKCHPVNRQPGSVPVLFGPHQLQPTSLKAAAAAAAANKKRRILVTDAWLAEDSTDKCEGGEVHITTSTTSAVSNDNCRIGLKPVNCSDDAVPTLTIATSTSTSANKGTNKDTNINTRTNTNSNTNADTITNTGTNNPAARTSNPPPANGPRFQSSFFQNLQMQRK